MCFFVRYKHEGGGYRVWVPKGELSSSLEIVFYEAGLAPATLNDSRPQPADKDEPTTSPTEGVASCVRSTRASLTVHGLTPRQRTTMDQRQHLIRAS